MNGRETVIEVKDLSKVYPAAARLFGDGGKEKLAVDRVSFDVHRGEIFGLLGPNGAGKTTTIKMLTTLLIPTSGSATVLGLDVVKDPVKLRPRINLVSGGERGLYFRLTGKQNLEFFSDMYRVPRDVKKKKIEDLLELVGLTEAADVRVEEYSRGMKQRLHLARGLVNDPEVLFLDEPTLGLDPEISRETRALIRRLSEKGMTILLTTHYMFEADELCDRLAIISDGRIRAMGSPYSMKESVRNDSIIEIEARELGEAQRKELADLPGVSAVSMEFLEGRQLARIVVDDAPSLIPTVAALLENRKVISIRVDQPTLEDAYIKMVSGK
ncbi:MAG TPA: ABC transporter ATP-binding protein [Methanomassiliicoccales archaeon]|nr:ABC transporter ATP-binding protein [Methanomassiliicoccales archaeon]HPR99048.1 ABC transporter ATP-binding protein [Methanomassiliicoccales archaeon]